MQVHAIFGTCDLDHIARASKALANLLSFVANLHRSSDDELLLHDRDIVVAALDANDTGVFRHRSHDHYGDDSQSKCVGSDEVAVDCTDGVHLLLQPDVAAGDFGHAHIAVAETSKSPPVGNFIAAPCVRAFCYRPSEVIANFELDSSQAGGSADSEQKGEKNEFAHERNSLFCTKD